MILAFFSRLKSLSFREFFANFSRNWFIPVSALFFFLTNAGVTDLDVPLKTRPAFDFYYAILPAVVAVAVISAVSSSFDTFMSRTKIKTRVIALLSALGACYCAFDVLKSVDYVWSGNTFVLRIVFMILGFPFAYVVNLLFWHKFESLIYGIIRENRITVIERMIYAALFILFCFYIVFCFLNSNAFYEADRYVDVIYTSDSPALVKFNCFVLLDHFENDLRQPLFAVFSAPLMGIPCLVGSLIPGIPMAVFIAFAQIIMMLFSAFILATELKLSPVQRICFILLSSFSYSFLLFAVMMEQYVVVVFWLVLTIHFMSHDKDSACMSSYAASGTLLISGALVPFILKPDKPDRGSIVSWIKHMCIYCIDFVLLLVLSGRIHLIVNAVDNFRALFSFTGEKVSIHNRLLQYLNFVGSCFFAPETKIVRFNGGYSGWYLAEASDINFIGIAIIFLSLAGFIVTRKNKLSVVSFGWMCFSVLVLVGIGWGSAENGMVLYSLYFGWPFLVLIFSFFKYIEERLRTKFIIPVMTGVMTLLLLLSNIPSIVDLINYAITEYPV